MSPWGHGRQRDSQTLKASGSGFVRSPSLIIAYSHCINHVKDMTKCLSSRTQAEASRACRFTATTAASPSLAAEAKTRCSWTPRAERERVGIAYNETRYRMRCSLTKNARKC
jgi:pyruvate/2-oxoacid:ferredoxin oxidoreductase beta subunit